MTWREPSELHRLALDYRSARSYSETVAAWTELERYVQQQMERSYQAGRAYEAGLRDGREMLKNQVIQGNRNKP